MHSIIKGDLGGAVVISYAQLSLTQPKQLKAFPVFQFDPGFFLCSKF